MTQKMWGIKSLQAEEPDTGRGNLFILTLTLYDMEEHERHAFRIGMTPELLAEFTNDLRELYEDIQTMIIAQARRINGDDPHEGD
jgi:hypothetical protein